MSAPTIDTITQTQLIALAIAHIHRFSFRISESHWNKSVNVAECRQYLTLWQGIYDKMSKPLSPTRLLTRDERNEIVDALESGDFEGLLEDAAKPGYVQRRSAYVRLE
jgi:hypothetical protein